MVTKKDHKKEKNILAEKYLQQSENDSLKDRFHIKASDFSDFLKTTILFEVLKEIFVPDK